MKWSAERYARLYTRDTPNWVAGPWQARALLPLVVRKLDRAGLLDLDDNGLDGLAALVGLPVEVVEVGMAWWAKKGTLVMDGTVLTMPNFVEAQECRQSDARRKEDSRERQRAEMLRDEQMSGAAKNKTSGRWRDDAMGHVYVVMKKDRSALKIGFTANAVADRVRQLEAQGGHCLQLLAFWEAGPAYERAAHEKFARFRVDGEWFDVDETIIRWAQSHQSSPPVTGCHEESLCAVPSRAVPSRAVPSEISLSSGAPDLERDPRGSTEGPAPATGGAQSGTLPIAKAVARTRPTLAPTQRLIDPDLPLTSEARATAEMNGLLPVEVESIWKKFKARCIDKGELSCDFYAKWGGWTVDAVKYARIDRERARQRGQDGAVDPPWAHVTMSPAKPSSEPPEPVASPEEAAAAMAEIQFNLRNLGKGTPANGRR